MQLTLEVDFSMIFEESVEDGRPVGTTENDSQSRSVEQATCKESKADQLRGGEGGVGIVYD